jgi:hypothetical protein
MDLPIPLTRRGRALPSFPRPPRPPVEPSVAAYTLAQIAYLENRPAEASRMMASVGDADARIGRVHRQRADIMREWVAAKGYPVPQPAATTVRLSIPMSFTRQLAHLLFGFGLAVATLAVLPLGLLAVAGTRSRRIRALVDERHQSQPAVGSAL